jgi:ferredoxin
LIVVGALLGGTLAGPLSRSNERVVLAERLEQEEAGLVTGMTLESESFRSSGGSVAELSAEAEALRARLRRGGRWAGAFVAFVVGARLLMLAVRRRQPDYVPDRGQCLSCGRCFESCPRERLRLGLPVEPDGHPAEPDAQGAVEAGSAGGD